MALTDLFEAIRTQVFGNNSTIKASLPCFDIFKIDTYILENVALNRGEAFQ